MNFISLIGFILVFTVHESKVLGEEYSDLPPRPCTHISDQKICNEEFEDAFKFALDFMKSKQKMESALINSGRVVADRTADVNLLRRYLTDPLVRHLESLQEPFEIVSDLMIYNHNISDPEKIMGLPLLTVRGEFSDLTKYQCKLAIEEVECDPDTRYRTATGECNNFKHTKWGSILTCYQRLLASHYEGASGFRLGKNGKPLPNARTLSLNIHQNVDRPWKNFTHMYTFFGQLLGHDIGQTPMATTVDNKRIQCCPIQDDSHTQCAPISISGDDPFYSKHNVRCLNYVRSVICPACMLGVREQMNQVTSFIDASFMYGNSEEETRSLRQFGDTGKLKTQNRNAGELLPRLKGNSRDDSCIDGDNNKFCFLAGDSRVNQHTLLTILHTIFVREHNRIAHELRRLNPHWEEETLFQEARRILGAEMQVITYKEYLPVTLGKSHMKFFNLPLSNETGTLYDPAVNPTLYTEFETAAFRFGHTLINSWIARYPEDSNKTQKLLRDDYLQPFDVYNENGIEELVSESIFISPQFFDTNLVPDVTNYFLRLKGEKTGLDLAAFEIQRGRDHGLPPYTAVLKACMRRTFKVQDFRDLTKKNLMTKESMKLLRKNYRHIDDIDMWTGILSESPLRNASVGPTAACIIGLQFYKLKFGDRFHFDHKNENGSFTSEQLKELKKTTLSMIICENTKIKKVLSSVMVSQSETNQIINCMDVPKMDLKAWKE